MRKTYRSDFYKDSAQVFVITQSSVTPLNCFTKSTVCVHTVLL